MIGKGDRIIRLAQQAAAGMLDDLGKCSAVGLDDGHRLWLGTNHYTTLLLLPTVAQHMADLILGQKPDSLEGSGRVGDTARPIKEPPAVTPDGPVPTGPSTPYSR